MSGCKIKQRFLLLSILFWFFIVLGCSSAGNELISQNILKAQEMINQARQNKAETYAPLELRMAEENLQAAKDALKDDEPEDATRKAEMAYEKAKLADQTSRTGKAKKQVQNEEKDLNMLRNEIDRAQKVNE